MPRFQGPALVLRTWDVGESDLLVSFFERERGRCRGIAKGAKRSKRRFGGLLSPFLLIQMEAFEKPGNPLVRIEGCTLLRYYASLHADLKKILIGCCLLEFMERVLPEGEGTQAFFDLLNETFACLDEQEDPDPLLWIFFAKCLELLGVRPQLRICIHCRRPLGKTGVFGFSVPQGGPVGGCCVRKGTVTHRIHSESLALVDRWLDSPFREAARLEIPRNVLLEVARVLEAFISYHVVREVRSLDVMKKTGKQVPGEERSS